MKDIARVEMTDCEKNLSQETGLESEAGFLVKNCKFLLQRPDFRDLVLSQLSRKTRFNLRQTCHSIRNNVERFITFEDSFIDKTYQVKDLTTHFSELRNSEEIPKWKTILSILNEAIPIVETEIEECEAVIAYIFGKQPQRFVSMFEAFRTKYWSHILGEEIYIRYKLHELLLERKSEYIDLLSRAGGN